MSKKTEKAVRKFNKEADIIRDRTDAKIWKQRTKIIKKEGADGLYRLIKEDEEQQAALEEEEFEKRMSRLQREVAIRSAEGRIERLQADPASAEGTPSYGPAASNNAPVMYYMPALPPYGNPFVIPYSNIPYGNVPYGYGMPAASFDRRKAEKEEKTEVEKILDSDKAYRKLQRKKAEAQAAGRKKALSAEISDIQRANKGKKKKGTAVDEPSDAPAPESNVGDEVYGNPYYNTYGYPYAWPSPYYPYAYPYMNPYINPYTNAYGGGVPWANAPYRPFNPYQYVPGMEVSEEPIAAQSETNASEENAKDKKGKKDKNVPQIQSAAVKPENSAAAERAAAERALAEKWMNRAVNPAAKEVGMETYAYRNPYQEKTYFYPEAADLSEEDLSKPLPPMKWPVTCPDCATKLTVKEGAFAYRCPECGGVFQLRKVFRAKQKKNANETK